MEGSHKQSCHEACAAGPIKAIPDDANAAFIISLRHKPWNYVLQHLYCSSLIKLCYNLIPIYQGPVKLPFQRGAFDAILYSETILPSYGIVLT